MSENQANFGRDGVAQPHSADSPADTGAAENAAVSGGPAAAETSSGARPGQAPPDLAPPDLAPPDLAPPVAPGPGPVPAAGAPGSWQSPTPESSPWQRPAAGTAPGIAPSAAPATAPSAAPWQQQTTEQPTVVQPGMAAGGYQPYPPVIGYPPVTGYPPVAGYPPAQQAPGFPSATSGAKIRRVLVATVALGAVALTAGGVGGFVGYALHDDAPSAVQAVSGSSGGAAVKVVDRSSLASIAAAVQPTVVDIVTGDSEGSGVVISSDGFIVTNNHVVSGADTVKITFNTGKRVNGTVVGTDAKTDLAVVKAQGVSGLTYATFADSDAAQVGDTVLAIGSPLGLQGSVTSGIISALHRTITVSDDKQQSPFSFQGGYTQSTTTIGDAIQTDAPINPGNSGGALVNMDGEIVGINSAIATSGSNATGNIGVGFAISSNKAKAVSSALIGGKKVSHPYLGVRVSAADSGGAKVESVESGSPADKAGLKVGDVIVQVDGQAIANSEDLVGAVQGGVVGGEMTLTVNRSGSQSQVTVTLTEAS